MRASCSSSRHRRAIWRPDEAAAVGPLLGPAFAAVAAGDLDTAFDTFLAAVRGPGARELVEKELGPEGLTVAVRQTVSLTYEGQAMAGLTFSAAEAAWIGQPTLLVRGGRSDEAPFAPRTVQALAQWSLTRT